MLTDFISLIVGVTVAIVLGMLFSYINVYLDYGIAALIGFFTFVVIQLNGQ